MIFNTIYTLPAWSFIGGESQTQDFNLYSSPGTRFDAEGYKCEFSISSYSNRQSAPVLTKELVLKTDGDGQKSIAALSLSPSETISLYGRYIYQIAVTGENGNALLARQGIMNIARNNYPSILDK